MKGWKRLMNMVCSFFETSAKEGICVKELFKLAANEIKFTFLDDKIDNHAQKLNDQKVIVNKKSLCLCLS